MPQWLVRLSLWVLGVVCGVVFWNAGFTIGWNDLLASPPPQMAAPVVLKTDSTIDVVARPLELDLHTIAPPVLTADLAEQWSERCLNGAVAMPVRIRKEPQFILFEEPNGTAVYFRRGHTDLFDPQLFYKHTTIKDVMQKITLHGYNPVRGTVIDESP